MFESAELSVVLFRKDGQKLKVDTLHVRLLGTSE